MTANHAPGTGDAQAVSYGARTNPGVAPLSGITFSNGNNLAVEATATANDADASASAYGFFAITAGVDNTLSNQGWMNIMATAAYRPGCRGRRQCHHWWRRSAYRRHRPAQPREERWP
jgi:hypothetical protein